jgi:hypothetical protein
VVHLFGDARLKNLVVVYSVVSHSALVVGVKGPSSLF